MDLNLIVYLNVEEEVWKIFQNLCFLRAIWILLIWWVAKPIYNKKILGKKELKIIKHLKLYLQSGKIGKYIPRILIMILPPKGLNIIIKIITILIIIKISIL